MDGQAEGTAETGTKAARKGAAFGTAGVTATAIALFAVAIYFGARKGGESPPPGTSPPTPTAAAPPQAPPPQAAAPQAAAPGAPAKHPPRHLQAANRTELETTLPKGASVEITANDGDAEALRLAEEIQAVLFLDGYHVGNVTRSVSTPPAKGVGLQPLSDGHWRVIVGAADE